MNSSFRHLCLIHEGSPAVHLGIIAPFLAQGLKDGGRALFHGSPTMAAALRSCLSGGSVNVPQEIQRGSLVLVTDQAHLKNGRFDPMTQLAMIEELYYRTLTEGYTGLWGAGDVAWEFGSNKNLLLLLEYEYGVGKLFDRLPELHGICQYHKDILPLHSVGSALLTHRAVFLDQTQPHDNPFYTPPQPVLSPFPNEEQIHRMLGIIAKR